MASSENFVNLPFVGISLLLKGNVLRQIIWLTPPKQDSRRNPGSTNSSSLQPCLMTSSESFVNLTHATGQITRATDNDCIAKTYFYFISSTQIVSSSKLNLNRKDHLIPLQLSGRTALKTAKKKKTAKQTYLQSAIMIGEGQVERRGSAI